jgi:hypothetical protein
MTLPCIYIVHFDFEFWRMLGWAPFSSWWSGTGTCAVEYRWLKGLTALFEAHMRCSIHFPPIFHYAKDKFNYENFIDLYSYTLEFEICALTCRPRTCVAGHLRPASAPWRAHARWYSRAGIYLRCLATTFKPMVFATWQLLITELCVGTLWGESPFAYLESEFFLFRRPRAAEGRGEGPVRKLRGEAAEGKPQPCKRS